MRNTKFIITGEGGDKIYYSEDSQVKPARPFGQYRLGAW